MYRGLQAIWDYIFSYNSNAIKPESLDEDWFVIVSESEQRAFVKQRDQVMHELGLVDNKRSKTALSELSHLLKNILSEEQITFVIYPIPSDVRCRIFKTVFTQLSPQWLEHLLVLDASISECWYPTEYERNILGEMIAMATKFTPDVLSHTSILEMLRSVHLSLINSLTQEITAEQSNTILQMLTKTSAVPIIKLWNETANIIGKSLSKMGRLPSQWEKDEKEQIQKVAEVKYLTCELDPIRKQYLLSRFGVDNDKEGGITRLDNLSESKISPNRKFIETQKRLEDLLIYKKKELPQPKQLSGDLLKAKLMLESTLFNKKI